LCGDFDVIVLKEMHSLLVSIILLLNQIVQAQIPDKHFDWSSWGSHYHPIEAEITIYDTFSINLESYLEKNLVNQLAYIECVVITEPPTSEFLITMNKDMFNNTMLTIKPQPKARNFLYLEVLCEVVYDFISMKSRQWDVYELMLDVRRWNEANIPLLPGLLLTPYHTYTLGPANGGGLRLNNPHFNVSEQSCEAMNLGLTFEVDKLLVSNDDVNVVSTRNDLFDQIYLNGEWMISRFDRREIDSETPSEKLYFWGLYRISQAGLEEARSNGTNYIALSINGVATLPNCKFSQTFIFSSFTDVFIITCPDPVANLTHFYSLTLPEMKFSAPQTVKGTWNNCSSIDLQVEFFIHCKSVDQKLYSIYLVHMKPFVINRFRKGKDSAAGWVVSAEALKSGVKAESSVINYLKNFKACAIIGGFSHFKTSDVDGVSLSVVMPNASIVLMCRFSLTLHKSGSNLDKIPTGITCDFEFYTTKIENNMFVFSGSIFYYKNLEGLYAVSKGAEQEIKYFKEDSGRSYMGHKCLHGTLVCLVVHIGRNNQATLTVHIIDKFNHAPSSRVHLNMSIALDFQHFDAVLLPKNMTKGRILRIVLFTYRSSLLDLYSIDATTYLVHVARVIEVNLDYPTVNYRWNSIESPKLGNCLISLSNELTYNAKFRILLQNTFQLLPYGNSMPDAKTPSVVKKDKYYRFDNFFTVEGPILGFSLGSSVNPGVRLLSPLRSTNTKYSPGSSCAKIQRISNNRLICFEYPYTFKFIDGTDVFYTLRLSSDVYSQLIGRKFNPNCVKFYEFKSTVVGFVLNSDNNNQDTKAEYSVFMIYLTVININIDKAREQYDLIRSNRAGSSSQYRATLSSNVMIGVDSLVNDGKEVLFVNPITSSRNVTLIATIRARRKIWAIPVRVDQTTGKASMEIRIAEYAVVIYQSRVDSVSVHSSNNYLFHLLSVDSLQTANVTVTRFMTKSGSSYCPKGEVISTTQVVTGHLEFMSFFKLGSQVGLEKKCKVYNIEKDNNLLLWHAEMVDILWIKRDSPIVITTLCIFEDKRAMNRSVVIISPLDTRATVYNNRMSTPIVAGLPMDDEYFAIVNSDPNTVTVYDRTKSEPIYSLQIQSDWVHANENDHRQGILAFDAIDHFIHTFTLGDIQLYFGGDTLQGGDVVDVEVFVYGVGGVKAATTKQFLIEGDSSQTNSRIEQGFDLIRIGGWGIILLVIVTLAYLLFCSKKVKRKMRYKIPEAYIQIDGKKASRTLFEGADSSTILKQKPITNEMLADYFKKK